MQIAQRRRICKFICLHSQELIILQLLYWRHLLWFILIQKDKNKWNTTDVSVDLRCVIKRCSLLIIKHVLSFKVCTIYIHVHCIKLCTPLISIWVNADIYSTEKIESSKSTTPTIPSLDYSPTIEQTSTSKPVHFHVTSMKTSSSISRSSHIDSTPSTKLGNRN